LQHYLFFHLTQFGKENGLKKKTFGRADARGLTGAEIAGRALRAQGNSRRAAYESLNTPRPAGPSVVSTLETASLISCAPSLDVLGLPASMAPARPQQEPTTGKRKRKAT